MRILWISPNGGGYKQNSVKGSGGWIRSLQEELVRRCPELELGLAFESTDSEPVKEGKISYFPICTRKDGIIGKLEGVLNSERKREPYLIEGIKRIINDYHPDLVHVWGVENVYAAAIPYINVPFVVHIQGLLSLSKYIYLPPGFSENDLKKIDPWWNPVTWAKKILCITHADVYKDIKYRAAREIRISKSVKNWIGRTDWDYKASHMLSPHSSYYHCEEIMRGDFDGPKWHYHYDGKMIRIQSSISETWYKGIDVVLKTSKILKDLNVCIEWNVYGVERERKLVNYIAKRLSILPEEVNVHFMGRVSGTSIRDGLLSSDVYVHPSYIENSSNAIAEAMMLGVPTIAQYVGGNSSMLKDDSGILVPANAPYDLAYAIQQASNKVVMEKYSERALAVAHLRQDKKKTIDNLLSIYKTIAIG